MSVVMDVNVSVAVDEDWDGVYRCQRCGAESLDAVADGWEEVWVGDDGSGAWDVVDPACVTVEEWYELAGGVIGRAPGA